MTAPCIWSDTITIMQAINRRMAKLHRADGTTDDYSKAYTYHAEVASVSGLLDVLDLLHWLLPRSDRCVVRGEPVDAKKSIRRLVYADKKNGDEPTLRDVPRRWLAVDWDGVARPHDVPAADLAACGDVVLAEMPSVFQRTACIIQASANHGIKPGCRLRGWFWCDRPMTGREMMRWLKGTPCDPSVWRPAQPIYTAAPVFQTGRTEHLPERLFLMPGEDWLQCPSVEELADPPAKPQTPAENIARGRHANAYVDKALARAADDIMAAGEGHRHDTIISQSRSLARLVSARLLTEKDLTEVLTKAAERAGKSDGEEIASCIEWGLANPSKGKLPEALNAA